MLRSTFVTFETDNTLSKSELLTEMAKTITSGYDYAIECDNRVLGRLDFRRSLVSGLPSPRRDGWTRERQSLSVT